MTESHLVNLGVFGSRSVLTHCMAKHVRNKVSKMLKRLAMSMAGTMSADIERNAPRAVGQTALRIYLCIQTDTLGIVRASKFRDDDMICFAASLTSQDYDGVQTLSSHHGKKARWLLTHAP
eukprot:SAG11_NODE_5484_length_1548_cov_0.992409_2_plen_121_part_00